MNTSPVNVAVLDGKTITQTTELQTATPGKPIRIKAIPDGKYILAEGEKGYAPEHITVKRVGKDLHVSLGGADPDHPQLIIEGFYDNHGELMGIAQDGTYHEYVAADAAEDHGAAFLVDGVSSPQVLNSQAHTGFGEGLFSSGAGLGMFWPALLGLAGVGLAGAAYASIRRHDDDNHHDEVAPVVPPTPGVGGVYDNGDPIANGGSTDNATPTFSGEGTPGNTIVITDNGTVIGEAVVGADGKWEFIPDPPLDAGSHEIVLIEKDPAGNQSLPSDGFEIIVDLTAPDKSVIAQALDDDGTQPDVIAQNGLTDDNTPTLTGTAEAGSTVEVFANGVKIGQAIVGADGTWAYTPTEALADGEYSFTTVAVDAAGNRGLASDPYVLTIDATAPSKPGDGSIEGPVADGGSTNDNAPPLSGSGLEPGDTVIIKDNGEIIGKAIVDDQGNWTYTPEPPLDDGKHDITIVVEDPAGNTSEESDPYTVVIDTTAPGKPGEDGNGGIDTITDNVGPAQGAILNGGSTDDTTPVFSGSKQQPGDKVTIKDNGKVLAEVTVDQDGNWAYTPDPLADGPHDFTMIVTDAAGNASAESDPYSVIVDTAIPGKPGEGGNGGIDAVIDDAGTTPVPILNGDATNDTTPVLSGGGQLPGTKVTIKDGDTVVGEAIADKDGNWTVPLDPLADGKHDLTMTVTNQAGNSSEESDPFTVIVDTTAPGKPGDGSIEGPVVNGGSTNDTAPPLGGGGLEPGDTVTIKDGDKVLAEVIVDKDGNWSYTPEPMTEGKHDITITATDAAGNESEASDPYTVIVDTSAPGQAVIGAVIDDQGNKTGPITSGDTIDDAEPQISGTAEPGSTAIIYDKGVEIGRAAVGADGNWSFSPSPALRTGTHVITVAAIDAAGNLGEKSAPFSFETIAPGAPATPAITGITDNTGDQKGPVESGGATDDVRPTISGTGEVGSVISIYNNGSLLSTVVVQADGKWSYTPTTDMAEGLSNITATATNAAGNVSEATAPYPITIDTTAPDKPGDGSIEGPVPDGDSTNDNTPPLSGSGMQPGDTITIKDGDKVLDKVTVDEDGNWSYTPDPMTEGTHDITITATDPAGNESEASDPYTVIIDTTAPGKPGDGSIEGPVPDGGSTDNTKPPLGGSGLEPGDKVTIKDNGEVLAEVTVDKDGNWSYTPDPMAEGEHDITIVVTDPAGNASEESDPYTVIVDTTAPSKPGENGSGAIDTVTDDEGNAPVKILNGGLTNDNTPILAGGKQQPGDKVTIRDGGTVVGEAIVDKDGNWTLPLDPLADGKHDLTMIVTDAAGNASEESDPFTVTVDTVAPDAPTSLEFNGSVVTVLFDGSDLAVGDTVRVTVGTEQFDVKLTQAQIDAGSVDVTTNANAAMTTSTAALIDAAGNVSKYLTPEVVLEDFEAVPLGGVPSGGSQDFGSFVFNWGGGRDTSMPMGIIAKGTVYNDFTAPSKGIALVTSSTLGNASITLDDGVEAGAVSFLVGQVTRPITLNFYDGTGSLVHSVVLPPNTSGVQEVSFQLPVDKTFSTVEFTGSNGDWLWIDDIKFSTGGYETVDAPTSEQVVGSDAYFGDDSANLFALNDTSVLNDADTVVNGGEGTDTLVITGADQVLDLDKIAAKLESVEVIDITGTGNNTLNVSLGDVLALGQTSLFLDDDKVQLMVKGDAGDVVNLDDLAPEGTDPGNWASAGQSTVGGVVYEVYSHSSLDAEILVQQGVTTHLV